MWIEPELEVELEVVPLSCSELLVALVAGEGVCTTNILEEKKDKREVNKRQEKRIKYKIRHNKTRQVKTDERRR